MGLFGCSHEFDEYRDGQLVCSRCGELKNPRTPRRVSIFHAHTWRARKNDHHSLYCTGCPATKTI